MKPNALEILRKRVSPREKRSNVLPVSGLSLGHNASGSPRWVEAGQVRDRTEADEVLRCVGAPGRRT